ncbi:MAG: Nif3-like dinuclear metal center hexameric protein [Saprospiraceae bacterium]|nr:Nif3-like dinuclear metal center hexameric protein [Saprospiraceae bacterium]
MTKVLVKDICRLLEDIAPLNLQEPYDNVGLILGHEEQEVTGILICLDSLESVVDEAIELGCNLIVAHHPIIFGGLKKINGNHYVEKIVIKAIQNNIAIYAAHTNLDNVLLNGVNQKIAAKLGLENTSILVEKLPNIGAGLLGSFGKAVSMDLFLQNVKNIFGVSVFRHTKILKQNVQKVALCGGSGTFLIKAAIEKGADVFLTADVKYHEFFEANNQITLVDMGHFESEQFTIELFYDIIRNKLPNFAVYLTKHITNPINYHY